LKVTTAELENRELQLDIEVEPAELDGAMRAAARRLAGKVNLPGFRKGKAPYTVVLNFFGHEAVLEEALEPLTQDLYRRALDEQKIEPAAPGQLREIGYDPLVLHMLVPLQPAVDLGAYREFRLPFEEPVVTDEMVDAEIEGLRSQQAVIEPAARPAQMNDQVRVRLSGHAHGVEGADELFAQQDLEFVLREGMVYPVPGFETHAAGLSAGENKRVEVAFPEDYAEPDLRGKTIDLDIQVEEVKSVTLPALDDEFAKTVGDYENLLVLRVKVREELEHALQHRTEDAYADQVIDALSEHAQVTYPAVMLRDEIDALVDDLERRVKRDLHMSLDDYLKVLSKDRAATREEMRPRAEHRLRRSLILQEVARRENVQVTDEDLTDEIESTLATLDGASPEQVEQLRQAIRRQDNLLGLASQVALRKAAQRLVAIARGQAPELEAPATGAELETPATGAELETPATGAEIEAPATGAEVEAPAAEPEAHVDEPAAAPAAGSELEEQSKEL
jgi:trigger factor